MLFDYQVILRIHLIQVFLKLSKCECIPFFILAVFFTMNLQTLICQVYLVTTIVSVILRARCSQVALLINIDPVVFSYYCPDSDVKLSCFV